jgi:hypothetical protein
VTRLLPIFEKAPLEFSKMASIIIDAIISALPVDNMPANKGSGYDDTQFYQIRVKPKDKETPLDELLTLIEKFLKSAKGKSMGVKKVVVNEKSPNSSKYSSVSFTLSGMDYDIVVAAGGNKGESFEKDMLLNMDNLIAGAEGAEGLEQAQKAFDALAAVDPVFKMKNIKGVTARSGSTKRSGDMSPSEMGKIIADIIVELKNGSKKYVSLKNSSGATVANFGCAAAFTEDLKVVTSSSEWKHWIAPFGIDAKRVEAGLKAAQDGVAPKGPDTDTLDKKLAKTSPIFKILQKLWGADYYYLREKGKGFTAMKIDADYVDDHLLKSLVITEIRYPTHGRKQISIYLKSATKRFKIEIRNSKGKIRPTEIKFGVMGDAK